MKSFASTILALTLSSHGGALANPEKSAASPHSAATEKTSAKPSPTTPEAAANRKQPIMGASLSERIAEYRKQMLGRFDRNIDGKLDPDERRTMRESIERKLFRAYDANQDGRLDAAERRKLMENEELGVYFWNDETIRQPRQNPARESPEVSAKPADGDPSARSRPTPIAPEGTENGP